MPSWEMTAERQVRIVKGSIGSMKNSKISLLPPITPIPIAQQWPSTLIPASAFIKPVAYGENVLQKNPGVQKEVICPPTQIQTIYSRKRLSFSETMLIFKRMALEIYYAPDTCPPNLAQCNRWVWVRTLSKNCTWHHEFSWSCKLLFFSFGWATRLVGS